MEEKPRAPRPKKDRSKVPNRHLIKGAIITSCTLHFIDQKEFPVTNAEFSCNAVMIVFKNGDFQIVRNKDLDRVKKILGVRYTRIKYWAVLPSKYQDNAIVERTGSAISKSVEITLEDLFKTVKDIAENEL